MMTRVFIVILSLVASGHASYQFYVDFKSTQVEPCNWDGQNLLNLAEIDCTSNIASCITEPSKPYQTVCIETLDEIPFPHRVFITYDGSPNCTKTAHSISANRIDNCIQIGDTMSSKVTCNATFHLTNIWENSSTCEGPPDHIKMADANVCVQEGPGIDASWRDLCFQ